MNCSEEIVCTQSGMSLYWKEPFQKIKNNNARTVPNPTHHTKGVETLLILDSVYSLSLGNSQPYTRDNSSPT